MAGWSRPRRPACCMPKQAAYSTTSAPSNKRSRTCDRRGVTARTLAAHPFIGYTMSQGLNAVIQAALSQDRVEIEPLLEVGLLSNAWALVNEGAGVALVDEHSNLQTFFPNVVRRPFVPD